MTTANKKHLFIFGPGYTAGFIGRRAIREGWRVSASYRDAAKAAALEVHGFIPFALEDPGLKTALSSASHLLTSVAPGPKGDPILPLIKSCADQLEDLEWLGYLSSTNIYGDRGGDWVDEDTPPAPNLNRGIRRLSAEEDWQDIAGMMRVPLHIFRLAGIYGPGRNAVRTVLDGRARRIFKQGQLFSRIHVQDIEDAVWRAMTSGKASQIFNLADDMPAPPQDIIEKAALRLGAPVPPLIPIEKADLSPMARSFYQESKRVKNSRVKHELGFTFRYPTFDSALEDLVAFELGDKKP
ncbi:SDR family NAD(P)-dependent oxidoreductase [Kordiimonas aestuarii]|uniref:SDR family NAD(P)-dependent oxidoreductase n=1 Tax=Kordiimonas aestuarii TaxID=1005925 RepID=UPI0021D0FED8|nr:SDR family NAD(P)-dependent oxidoreductase [Kordiimonas aestuarii]